MLYYIYNDVDNLVGFKYNNDLYYYQKNAQEDIIGILDSSYSLVAKYEYDSWGSITSVVDANGNDISNNFIHIGNINPFRYRSYYYDVETRLYYLNSRYYNPSWGRFINADSQLNLQNGFTGLNLYAYGGNNPINTFDDDGHAFMFITAAIGAIIGGVIGGIKAAKKKKNVFKGVLFGAAIGGLIGLGAGALIGATLAGSFTASTAGVISGASAMMVTVSNGGLSSAISSIGSNMSNALKGGGELTTLYRSISSAEAISIESKGSFSLAEGGMEIKQFTFSYKGAVEFGSNYRQNIVASASVPTKNIIDYTSKTIDSHIFRSGVVSVPREFLDDFNGTISGIIRIFK